MGVIDKIFICCIILLLIVVVIIYNVVKVHILKSSNKHRKIKILRIITVLIVFIICIFALNIGNYLYRNPQITDPNYDRGTYSVVLHNKTDKEINGIDISVGANKLFVTTVNNIKSGEYRKVNISTHLSDFINSILPPYDVYVKNENGTEICIGYFGIDTGGIELISIESDEDGNTGLNQAKHSSNEYVKIRRMDRKNQKIMTWYD